jgi:hypothetical protein
MSAEVANINHAGLRGRVVEVKARLIWPTALAPTRTVAPRTAALTHRWHSSDWHLDRLAGAGRPIWGTGCCGRWKTHTPPRPRPTTFRAVSRALQLVADLRMPAGLSRRHAECPDLDGQTQNKLRVADRAERRLRALLDNGRQSRRVIALAATWQFSMAAAGRIQLAAVASGSRRGQRLLRRISASSCGW